MHIGLFLISSFLAVVAFLQLFASVNAGGVFSVKNTGALYSVIDPSGDYYYEYERSIAKLKMEDGSVLAKKLLDNNMRFTAVAIVPSGAFLIFATGDVFTNATVVSGLGVFNTDTANFEEISSLKINYHDGVSEKVPRYERITVFNTKVRNLRATSYEIMIGGRVGYNDDTVKDTLLLYYGAFHSNNKTIDITKYFTFDQGTNSNTLTVEAGLNAYSESGFLAILEDTKNSSNAISLVKFTQSVAVNQIYEVNLMSFKRDLSQINWMMRYQENYQAEARVSSGNIYLVLTKDSDLFIQTLDISTGSALSKVHYTIGNNEKLYFPQMQISDRFESLFLISQVTNVAVSPTPSENKAIRISLFDRTTLTLKANSFTYTQLGTPYDIQIHQTLDEESVIIKGILDGIVDDNESRFTIAMYPQLSTQDIGSCYSSAQLSLTLGASDPNNVTESTLTGFLIDALSHIRWNTSDIAYLATGSLTPTTI
jgi:hypothetical protein